MVVILQIDTKYAILIDYDVAHKLFITVYKKFCYIEQSLASASIYIVYILICISVQYNARPT